MTGIRGPVAAWLAAGILLAAHSGSAHAVHVYSDGVGGASCRTYVTAIQQHDPNTVFHMTEPTDQMLYYGSRSYVEWLVGFVTAVNLTLPAAEEITVGANGIALWVNNYCAKHPDDPLFLAAAAFSRTHSRWRERPGR